MMPGSREPRRLVLVSAHYDHLGIRNGRIHPGADDNASGVAAMLAIARWFAANPPPMSLLFVAFDGEEQGLQGARHFVEHPPVRSIASSAVVNMDMVGRGDKNVLYVAGTHHYPALKPLVEDGRQGTRHHGALRSRSARASPAATTGPSRPITVRFIRERAVSLLRRRGSCRLSQADGHRRQDPARVLPSKRRNWCSTRCSGSPRLPSVPAAPPRRARSARRTR